LLQKTYPITASTQTANKPIFQYLTHVTGRVRFGKSFFSVSCINFSLSVFVGQILFHCAAAPALVNPHASSRIDSASDPHHDFAKRKLTLLSRHFDVRRYDDSGRRPVHN
jgi:hypothetical protein